MGKREDALDALAPDLVGPVGVGEDVDLRPQEARLRVHVDNVLEARVDVVGDRVIDIASAALGERLDTQKVRRLEEDVGRVVADCEVRTSVSLRPAIREAGNSLLMAPVVGQGGAV